MARVYRPVFSTSVTMPDGTTYRIDRLLGGGRDNAKLGKSDAQGNTYRSFGLSLAPAKTSGFNLCASASAGCIAGCLHTSGLAAIWPRSIHPARIAKARMLREQPARFVDMLRDDLRKIVARSWRDGFAPAIRLNVFSDVMWEREHPWIFREFPMITFYDYSKHFLRMLRFLRGDFPTNYHLTFSRSESNEAKCLDVLAEGGNVAVPFDVKYSARSKDPLPDSWNGFPVIDGDSSDLRFLDPKGSIIGLRAKGLAKTDRTGFVVNVA
jgi:hypothetical protein